MDVPCCEACALPGMEKPHLVMKPPILPCWLLFPCWPTLGLFWLFWILCSDLSITPWPCWVCLVCGLLCCFWWGLLGWEGESIVWLGVFFWLFDSPVTESESVLLFKEVEKLASTLGVDKLCLSRLVSKSCAPSLEFPNWSWEALECTASPICFPWPSWEFSKLSTFGVGSFPSAPASTTRGLHKTLMSKALRSRERKARTKFSILRGDLECKWVASVSLGVLSLVWHN